MATITSSGTLEPAPDTPELPQAMPAAPPPAAVEATQSLSDFVQDFYFFGIFWARNAKIII